MVVKVYHRRLTYEKRHKFKAQWISVLNLLFHRYFG